MTSDAVKDVYLGEASLDPPTREPQKRRHVGKGSRQRRLPEFTTGTLGEAYDVKELHESAQIPAEEQQDSLAGRRATPSVWNSSMCMLQWGMSELQTNPDPAGYVIFVDGREQLGGNKFLVSDGLFMAKALNRTFVEYPVKDARVAPFWEASLGLGEYWDLSNLCMYQRILDLHTFRGMVADGRLAAEDFVTVRSGMHEALLSRQNDEAHIVNFFENYRSTQVIVMESSWKSSIEREPLRYMKPNPFFLGLVNVLLWNQKDWGDGTFVAVQWRTELSAGNLTACYEEVRAVVEEQRLALGYGTHQVLFNIDLHGKTSGTYDAEAKAAGAEALRLITQDYPQALDNVVHRYLSDIQDSGIKAFVSGLAVASSQVMIGSSLNKPATKTIKEAYRCQKPFSGYITLITEWRRDMLEKSADSVVRMFPFGDEE